VKGSASSPRSQRGSPQGNTKPSKASKTEQMPGGNMAGIGKDGHVFFMHCVCLPLSLFLYFALYLSLCLSCILSNMFGNFSCELSATRTHTHTHTRTRTRTQTHLHTDTQTRTHIHKHTNTYAHTRTIGMDVRVLVIHHVCVNKFKNTCIYKYVNLYIYI